MTAQTVIKFSDEQIKEFFDSCQGSDADYFIVVENFNSNGWGLVPDMNHPIDGDNFVGFDMGLENQGEQEFLWETMDEAVKLCLSAGWDKITFYDLYQDFETAFIKTIKGGK